jgi:hypothetical protein
MKGFIMEVVLINHCQKIYRPDVERVIRKILERIPSKFLDGIEKVELFDFGKEEFPMMRYVKEAKGETASIEIYMDSPAFSGIPFFSVLGLNIHFLDMINHHIEKSIKPKSKDIKILSYPSAMVNYDWMYLGVWSPLLIVVKILNFIYSRIRISKNLIFYWVKNLEKDINKTNKR